MQHWYFSEMAYPYLPDQDSYDSVRVTLPSRLIDPVKANALWTTVLEEYRVAAELGFGVMTNEHHSTATCINPAGPIVAGIFAKITEDVPILILGNPIANKRNPVRVAEEMALIDVISGGRLQVGFVRGVPYEISATNTKPVDMPDRFWEAHDLIVKAWTTPDGPFSWTGRHFEHRQVNIWPRPYQDPHPPVWITTLNPGGTKNIADRDYVCATFLLGRDATRALFEAYRSYHAAAGYEPRHDRLAYCALVYVGETAEEARRGAEKLHWYATSNKVPPHFQAPPGYIPPAIRVKALRSASSLPHGGKSVDHMIDDGSMFAGTADEVYEQIRSFYQHVGGFGHLLCMGQAGFLDYDETVSSLRLFADRVAPRLSGLSVDAQLAPAA
jgi:alkanesulfonate monooxygenase SsuD/methylene tetrahydromethanopterin reductase-like flavin-dependent oxidoreductase (luciferase family)